MKSHLNILPHRVGLYLAFFAIILGCSSTSHAQALEGYFCLTTNLVEGKGFVLEGGDGNGPARLTKKGNFTGQLWKTIPAEGGYFYLTTKLMEGKDLVLEGGDGRGSAHLTKKGNFTGQLWKAIPDQGGYFYLTTNFMEKKGLALEGGDGNGPAHLATKGNFSGQAWKTIPQAAAVNPNRVLKSGGSGNPVVVQFTNGTANEIGLYWIDFEGVETFYEALRPGQTYEQSTGAGHIWRARSGRADLGTYTATEGLRQQHTFNVARAQVVEPIHSNQPVDQQNFRQNRALNAPINLLNPDYDSIHLAIALVTNETRAKHGKSKLGISPNLTAAARMHASDMVRQKFFSHHNTVTASKGTPEQRAAMHGISNPTIAENISQQFAVQYIAGAPIAPGQKFPPHSPLSMADAILKSWMKSAGHRNNILSDKALSIGCGAQLDLGTDPEEVYAVQKYQLYNPIQLRGGP